MKFSVPSLTRRDLLTSAVTVGAAVSLNPLIKPALAIDDKATPLGKKGKAYPDERRKYTDSKSGKTVWQLTRTPAGRKSSYSYYNVPKTTPDGRWAVYTTDRWNGSPKSLDLFKMDLRTGESVQLTESGDVETSDNVTLSSDGKEVFFFDQAKNLRVVDMEDFKERTIATLPANAEAPLHNSALRHDSKVLLTARPLEPPVLYTYCSSWARHHALIAIQTDTGEMHNLVEGQFPIGINEFNPANGEEIMWDIHGAWETVHRPWIIKADGTGNRAVMQTIKGEGSGHQFFGWSGKSVFSVFNGGRYPQGLWGADLDGSNERCVCSGGTHAHACVSPEEDRFIIDERYGQTNHLWMAKKGSHTPEILVQTVPWFELQEGQKGVAGGEEARAVNRVIAASGVHPHSRFLPDGTKVAYSNKAPDGGGDIWIVEV